MASFDGKWINPDTGHEVKVYSGYSWWTLFVGVFYYAYKGMWKWVAIGALAGIMTSGLAFIVMAFKTHEWHKDTLREKGYKPKSEDKSSQNSDNSNNSISKLKERFAEGEIDEEEYKSKKDLLES